MKRTVLLLTFLALSVTVFAKPADKNSDKITVACYYFPNYHTRDTTDMRISRQHFENWSEWELIKNAKPRFEGHEQPKVPLWGYEDEKDPKVMQKKIKAAVDHGVDVFIFDWYTYEGRPFLNRCLDEGFLKAKNTNTLKFALMWANHDWLELYPYTAGDPQDMLYPGVVTPELFDRIGDEIVAHYFSKPNYWLIDGKAYFSIYDVQNFINSFGSVEATRAAMEELDRKAIQAGLRGVHWNLVAWSFPVLPFNNQQTDSKEIIKLLSFDSATSYVWIHHTGIPELETDYNWTRDTYLKHWDAAKAEYTVPYYPNVSVGWDPSPRTNQDKPWQPSGYPYTNTIGNNTPENFKAALQMTKDKLLSDPEGPRIFNINCWNEWTEGSYLEPDTKHGMAYLEALKEVFKSKKR